MKQKLARRRQFRELNDKTCDFLFFLFPDGFFIYGVFYFTSLEGFKDC